LASLLFTPSCFYPLPNQNNPSLASKPRIFSGEPPQPSVGLSNAIRRSAFDLSANDLLNESAYLVATIASNRHVLGPILATARQRNDVI